MKRFLIFSTVFTILACVSFADACGRRGRASRGGGGGGCDGGDCGSGVTQSYTGTQNCNSCNSCPQDCATNNCECSYYGPSDVTGCVKIKVCKGNNRCYLADVPVTGAGTSWQTFPDASDVDLLALFHNGTQIGTWHTTQRWYSPYDAASRTFAAKQHWGAVATTQTPATVPTSTTPDDPFASPGANRAPTAETSKVSETEQPKFGAIWPAGNPNATSRVESKPTAEVELPRDGNLPFAGITAADASLRDKFRQAWDSEALRPWKGRFRIKTYATNDPMLKDREGQQKWFAEPGLYFEDKDGVALGKMSIEDYAGNPEMLAFALNQIDPQFKPELVPDLAHPPEPETLSEQLSESWPLICKAAFLLGLVATAACVCVYASITNRGTNVSPEHAAVASPVG